MELTDQEVQQLGGVDLDELIAMNATFEADLVVTLLKSGEIVKRQSEKYGWQLRPRQSGCGEADLPDLALVNEKGEVVAFSAWTTADLLANDWQVVKANAEA